MSSDAPATTTRETIETNRNGHFGRITLSRPDALNTFSTQLARELDDALQYLDDDPDVRAVIVDGVGDAFSAGIDVSEHADHDSKDEYQEWVAQMEAPFHTIVEMRTPVVAAVHGHAAANGLGLVAACDLAVAAEGTKFGATAPKVGLFCMGPAVPLMTSLTRKRYNEMLLTGELVDAETALDWGLINRVVPEGEHVEKALDIAEPMVEKSPVGIQMGKQAVTEMAGLGYHEAIEYSNERFAELCTTDDARDGIQAFLDGDPLGAEEWPEQ